MSVFLYVVSNYVIQSANNDFEHYTVCVEIDAPGAICIFSESYNIDLTFSAVVIIIIIIENCHFVSNSLPCLS